MQVLCRTELQPRDSDEIVSGFGFGRFDLGARSVAPEPLEVVEVAGLPVEDVHDHIAVVEEYPLAVVLAFAPQDAPIRPGLQLHLDLFDQGLDMPVRRTGGDDEDIRDDDEFGNVEEEDVFALLVGNRRSRLVGECG